MLNGIINQVKYCQRERERERLCLHYSNVDAAIMNILMTHGNVSQWLSFYGQTE